MRHRYRHLDPALLQALLEQLGLQELFQKLVLAAGGDVEEAMEWLRRLQEQGYLDPSLDLEAFFAALEEQRFMERTPEGRLRLGSGGERRLRQGAFDEIFTALERGSPGYHPLRAPGEGPEPLEESRRWAFGDDLHHIDPVRTLQNALKRTRGGLELAEDDLEVRETEHLTSCATVLAIDISHSMVLYGEDRITPAKTVALALTELITTRFAKDSLEVVLFGDRAKRVPLTELPHIDAGPYHTNTREALSMARGLLSRLKQPNKQIILITDGKPSAITEAGGVYKNPYGLDLKIVNKTLEEADLCRRQGIVITSFMIATDPSLVDFIEKLTRINRGRAFYASPYDLGEFILADYIRNRRRRVR
jgi:uncharacterized protein with von Willebrand factor type A (vWA) domain